jgi:hypothetical protein
VSDIELKLTETEAKALVVAASIGMRSGKMLEALPDTGADFALIEAIVKLRRALDKKVISSP